MLVARRVWSYRQSLTEIVTLYKPPNLVAIILMWDVEICILRPALHTVVLSVLQLVLLHLIIIISIFMDHNCLNVTNLLMFEW